VYSHRQRSGWPAQAEAWIRFATLTVCLLWATSILSLVLYGSGKDSDAAKPQRGAKAGAGPHPQLNINRATVTELKTLPGVGEATAQRIVEYRTKNPPFRRIEELLIIRGISRNRLEQIRNRIRLD
jgi:competence ComEA-like helix-hairpin-helix protein